jgi:hypothetical protein
MTLPAIANGTVAAIAVPPVAKPTPMPIIAPPAPPAAAAAKGVARLVASELSNAWPHFGQVMCAMRCASLFCFAPGARPFARERGCEVRPARRTSCRSAAGRPAERSEAGRTGGSNGRLNETAQAR